MIENIDGAAHTFPHIEGKYSFGFLNVVFTLEFQVKKNCVVDHFSG